MNFGKMGNMSNMLKQAQQLQKKLAEAQEKLVEERVEGSSGGGMVTAVVNGQGDLVSLKIDPEVIDPEEADVLEDLVLAAVTEACRKAKELMNMRMSGLTGGMGLPF